MSRRISACAEAAKLAGGPVHGFKARDPGDLSAMIRRHLPPASSPLVMIDAVMPATGVLAPVAEYLAVLREFAPATLLLDDAHGVGVLGDERPRHARTSGPLGERANGGAGADGVTLMAGGTLAKALGGFGGVVAGSEAFVAQAAGLVPLFRWCERPAGAHRSGLGESARTDRRRSVVPRSGAREQCAAARRAACRWGWIRRTRRQRRPAWPSAMRPTCAVCISALREAGHLVPAVGAYPGVGPEGVLRFAVCSGHTHAMIDELLDCLRTLL